MIHLGDITKISGYDVPPVDTVIGGSPCQDLSVAGKRAGLAGTRSGLFMEQIRIIKEMRDADIRRGRTGQFVRPRFMVWENVVGAFSSNKGNDFRAVLEEAVRVADPDAPDVPLPPKGKWPLADCWMGDGWSVAYRVLDAQFWGVPQRRRRIALVADFGGHAAPEILFVRQSVCGDIEAGGAPGKTAAAGTESSLGTAIALRMRAGCEGGGKGALIQVEKSGMLGCNNDQAIFCTGQAIPINTMLATRHKQLGRGTGFGIGEPVDPEFTISTSHSHAVFQPDVICIQGAVVGRSEKAGPMGKGWRDDGIAYTVDTKAPSVVCAGFQHKAGARTHGIGYEEEKAPTLTSEQLAAVHVHQNQLGEVRTGTVAGTLSTNSNATGRNAPLVFDARGNGDGKTVCTLTGDHQDRVTDYTAIVMRQNSFGEYRDGVGTLTAGTGTRHTGETLVVSGEVRRLTPLECERLQGYPDGWTDIGPWEKTDKKGKTRTVPCADSLRYKALGNSIALPPWAWLLKRLCGCYERTATMASLFDGIGGFPLIWERLNGPGSCLWASEIEQFPIAVTKRRFGGGKEEAQ